MFPPTSLISTACAPKSFDFYTCSNDDLLEFTIPIEFIVSRTSLVHGLASWFDLDFQPRPAPGGEGDVNWDFPVVPSASASLSSNAWQWMTQQEQPLNPGPTPAPPADGLTVTLSTGPNGESQLLVSCRVYDVDVCCLEQSLVHTGSKHFFVLYNLLTHVYFFSTTDKRDFSCLNHSL